MFKNDLALKKNNEIGKAPAKREIILSEKNVNEKFEKNQVNSDETLEDENGNKVINVTRTEENSESKNGEIQKDNRDNSLIQANSKLQANTNYDKLIQSILSRLKELEEKEQKSYEKINILQQENNKSNEKINIIEQENTQRKKEIMRLNYILGRIQIRDMAKNFLKSFNKYLSKDEKRQIKENSNKRGEITLKEFRREFNKSCTPRAEACRQRQPGRRRASSERGWCRPGRRHWGSGR